MIPFGFNSSTNELQAATQRVKLQNLANYNAKRRSIALLYNESFEVLLSYHPKPKLIVMRCISM